MIQILGWFLFILGAIIAFGHRWFRWIGHLPGDFTYQRGNVTVLIPLGTCILFGSIFSLVMSLFARR